MGWKDAKIAGRTAFKESTGQLKNNKVKVSDTAESAQKVSDKTEKNRKSSKKKNSAKKK